MSDEKHIPLVIYHANCWDGFCAAWIARKALGEIEPYPGYYGQSPPNVRGRDVYLLDFSYPREHMRTILGQARFVVVLDHHKTAQEALNGLVDEFIQRPDLIRTDSEANPNGQELPFVRFDMERSGGRLAWEYFWDFHISRGEKGSRYSELVDGSGRSLKRDKAPWLVDYTEDRDLWRHALPDSENINAALRSYPLDFALWDTFHDAVGQREMFKREGEAIRRAERQIINTHVRNAKEIDLAGHRVLAVNATVLFSEIAGELAKGRPFGACYFDRQDGKRQWSLRSDEAGLDVSAIAKAYSGGGHVRAAGFEQVIQ